jgi:hypothetical protein
MLVVIILGSLKGVVNRKGGVILPEDSLVKTATATALSFNKEGCKNFFNRTFEGM